jgi:large subunit ribosomal protein L29
MATGTPELTVENLDGMDNEQLNNQVKKVKEELFNLRFQLATGQLETHGRLRALRRDIARIYTILRERELGIRTEPTGIIEAEAKKKKAEASKDDSSEDEDSVEVELEDDTADAETEQDAEVSVEEIEEGK